MAPIPLNAAELLDAAAACLDGGPAHAGAYMAALSLLGLSPHESAGLAIGERDGALVALYAAMFGPNLELATGCPHCAARLDVRLTTQALTTEPPPAAPVFVEIGGRTFGVRPLDSIDLAAVAELGDVAAGRVRLASRSLIPVDGAGTPETLSEDDLDAIAGAVAAVDPGSDLYVPLTCSACGTAWDAPVDIAQMLTTEIEAAADTLLDDVHDLALAFHWSEAAILALPATRRRAYLERLRA